MQASQPIGVFDSGVGGLSVLRALRAELPQEHFVYFADSGHAPYGERDTAQVLARARAITTELLERHDIKALVIACNTATAVAIHLIRAEHPGLPIIGVEPALKPAAALTRTRRVGVMATRGTLESAKFAALLDSLCGLTTKQGKLTVKQAPRREARSFVFRALRQDLRIQIWGNRSRRFPRAASWGCFRLAWLRRAARVTPAFKTKGGQRKPGEGRCGPVSCGGTVPSKRERGKVTYEFC